ncbi:hypothetical protein L486_08234 [Kwoniella mangroviensis CBS 10435]|uniref:Uncharacterized protein n=1 Tax=Kwoniella mangroviensis CBS 10435 TaxID=1331196 RepID=A0A1B9IG81_9TREE|nr:hypothetical protein L486_08234 [Kwoniella mangroviensis CBS 10435]
MSRSIQGAETFNDGGVADGGSAPSTEPQFSVRVYGDSNAEPYWQSIQSLDAKQSNILAQYFEGVSKELSKHRAAREQLKDTQKDLDFSNFGLRVLGLGILTYGALSLWSLGVDQECKARLRTALSECKNNLDWVRNNGFTMGEAEVDPNGTCPNDDGIVIEVSSMDQ